MRKPKQFYVYIMTNPRFHVLYTGIRGNLPRRVFEHKNKLIAGFTRRYNLTRLVFTSLSPIHMLRLIAKKRSKAGAAAKRFA